MAMAETVQRIEPARLEEPGEAISDVVAELAAATATLAGALHPRTAANLAVLVRVMNAYYSNLIEGHNIRLKDIERALAGELDADRGRRNLQLEAAAHVRVQAQIDELALEDRLQEPASTKFLQWLHREFYRDAPEALLRVSGAGREFLMGPGAWRSRPEHDVAVGRHAPPSSARARFHGLFRRTSRIRANGQSRAHHFHGSCPSSPQLHPSVPGREWAREPTDESRDGTQGWHWCTRTLVHFASLARGLESRDEYKRMMDDADSPKRGDLDGRGNLSQGALSEFILWYLRVALDQVQFMSSLFELDTLSRRLRNCVELNDTLKPETARLLEEALIRGEF